MSSSSALHFQLFVIIVFFIGILIGSVIWAMVVGTICAMMATGDPHTTAYKHSMDALNDFLRDTQMPQEIGVAARAYLRNTRELYKKSSYNELITTLSPELKADVVLHMSAKTLENVWYLGDGLEQAARVEPRASESGHVHLHRLEMERAREREKAGVRP